MRRIGALVAAIGLFTLCSGAGVFAATDDGSKLTITSPAPGAKVGKDIELVYELTKGTQATHAHCFVDGEYQKSSGTHEIKVIAADKDYQMLAAEAAIKVEVQ
jgi:hypothetical protein